MMGDFWVIADHWGVNRVTLHDVAVIGGQSHDVLEVFDHVQKLIVGSSYDICAIWSRDDVVRLHL